MERVTAFQIRDFLKEYYEGNPVSLDQDFDVTAPVTLDDFEAGGVSFCNRATLPDTVQETPRGLLIIGKSMSSDAVHTPAVSVDNPRLAFGRVVERFFAPKPAEGVHPTAIIAPSAKIGRNVAIGPYCVVGDDCHLGDDVRLANGVVLAPRVTIGAESVVLSNTTLGEAGFGVEVEADGSTFRLPHLGGLEIGKRVFIGSNTFIAGGTLKPTQIREDVQIDSEVFIAHNVDIGRGTMIISNAQVSGSVVMGPDCWIGPNATIRNKLTIGGRTLIGMGAVVVKDLPENVIAAGNPAKVMRARYPD